jgi:polyphosphate kinase
VDPEVIDALYLASEAGVEIDLIVRGVCCLRPGVAGLSERIRVVSVVGRFLEHSRIYYFGNGRKPDVLIGSADAMRRNLDRRIEVLVPVEEPALVRHLHDQVIEPYLRDTVKAWQSDADGHYVRRQAPEGEKPFDAQSWLMEHPGTKALYESGERRRRTFGQV